MALRQLLTDPTKFKYSSRSLQYGNDRPGGGSSKQPYIVKDLPKVDSPPSVTFPDFLLRDPKNALENRKDDLERIGKFLTSTQGDLFIAKQELLSLQNPIVPGRPNRSNPVNGLYYPYMTLAQVGLAGTGAHIEKQGTFPIFSSTEKYDYIYTTEHRDEDNNRLALLYKSKIQGTPSLVDRREKYRLGLIPTPGANDNPQNLMSYIGGPTFKATGKTVIPFAANRVYGGSIQDKTTRALRQSSIKSKSAVTSDTLIKITKIGVSQKSTDLKYITINTGVGAKGNDTSLLLQNSVYRLGNTFPEENVNNTTNKGVYTFNQVLIGQQTAIGQYGSTDLTSITDFRKKVREAYTQALDTQVQEQTGIIFFDYTSNVINREQRVGLGNPGKRTRNRGKLSNYDNATVDMVNMIPLYYDDIVLDPYGLTRDLVKFRFEIVDNKNPNFSTFVHFRAFLGTISDGFTADWEATRYIGRGEAFYNYKGFSRGVRFTFKVHAQSRAEMKSIYQKLNYLATSLAPDYTNGYMKGNLIRLTIGDYLYAVPGFISNLDYTIPEEGSWEIGLTEPENGVDSGVLETPMYLEVSVAFTPIHDFVPQLSADKANALITRAKNGIENPYLDGSKIYNPEKEAISKNNLKQFATTGSI
jgi:hypothetical protein